MLRNFENIDMIEEIRFAKFYFDFIENFYFTNKNMSELARFL